MTKKRSAIKSRRGGKSATRKKVPGRKQKSRLLAKSRSARRRRVAPRRRRRRPASSRKIPLVPRKRGRRKGTTEETAAIRGPPIRKRGRKRSGVKKGVQGFSTFNNNFGAPKLDYLPSTYRNIIRQSRLNQV